MGILYTILRFMVDFSRHYEVNEKLGPLSHNQVVCIVLFIIFSGMVLREMLFKEVASARERPVIAKGLEAPLPSRVALALPRSQRVLPFFAVSTKASGESTSRKNSRTPA